MTVEAALLMPLVLSGMAALLCLSFFQYDRATYEMDAYRACYIASVCREEGAAGGVLQKEAASRFGTGYLMAGTPAYSAGENDGVFRIAGSGEAGLWEARFDAEAGKYDPPAGIRRYRRLGALAKMALDAIEK